MQFYPNYLITMTAHIAIGSRNTNRQTLPTTVKLTYLSVYDRRDDGSDRAASPSSPSSLTHVNLDGKTGLVPGLVPGFQGWKCPGTLAQT